MLIIHHERLTLIFSLLDSISYPPPPLLPPTDMKCQIFADSYLFDVTIVDDR